MAKIRGSRDPMPTKGGSPTGIFSSRGRQKNDPLVGSQKSHQGMTAANYRHPKVDPVTRDNRIK